MSASPGTNPARSRRRLLRLAAGAALVLAAALAGHQLWAEYHLRAGRRALDAYALPRARRHFRLCLKARPRSATTHLLAARAARAAGDYDDAERHLKACFRFGGETTEVCLEEQLLDAQRGTPGPQLERSLWRRVDQGHPQAGRIYEALALGYLRTYRMAEVSACLDRWLALGPDNAQALFIRGLLCEGLQNFAQAGKDYRRAVDLAPEHFEARKRLAEYLLFANEPDEAAGQFEHLLRSEPDEPALRFGLARCRRRQGRLAEAREALDRLLAGPPQFAWLVERGRVAQAEEDYDGAEGWFRQALEVGPPDAEACQALASCLARRGRRDEAQRYLDRGKEIERDLERLRHLFEQMERRPTDAELRYQAALICLRNGQAEEGRRWLLSAVRFDPAHEAARQRLEALGGR